MLALALTLTDDGERTSDWDSSLLGMRERDVDDGRGLRTRVDRCIGEDGGDMELLHRHGCHSS
jgi:hypothetical protein